MCKDMQQMYTDADADEWLIGDYVSRENDLMRPNATPTAAAARCIPSYIPTIPQFPSCTFLHNVAGICSVVISPAEKRFNAGWKGKRSNPLQSQENTAGCDLNLHVSDLVVRVRGKRTSTETMPNIQLWHTAEWRIHKLTV